MIPEYLKESQLFVECIEALGPNVSILNAEESIKFVDSFELRVPFCSSGSRIDWSKIERKTSVDSPEQIITNLNLFFPQKIDLSVYLFWENTSLPVVKTNLQAIIKSYEYIVCNGFETWMYNPEQGYIIEHYYLGEINIGII